MNEPNSITAHDQHAEKYDEQVRTYGSHAAEILFGLCYEYLQPGERLLDLGIGTGLSSQDYAKAGLDIYGVDGSAPMLEVCRAKGFARELKQFDLSTNPWPYEDSAFDLVLACGLFHFFGDLTPQFSEASRLLDTGGVFAFTFMSRSGVAGANAPSGSYLEITRSGVPGAAHSPDYVAALLEHHRFTLLKQARFLLWSGHDVLDDVFTAYVAQKQTRV